MGGTLNSPNGVSNYSQAIVSTEQFLIERRLNEPSLCSFAIAPSSVNLATPVRHGRVIVSDDSGVVLFTGYVGTEPVVSLAGENDA